MGIIKEILQELGLIKRPTPPTPTIVVRDATPEEMAQREKTSSTSKGRKIEIDWQEGSPKQISWAKDIVREFMRDAKELIKEAKQEKLITKDEASTLVDALYDGISLQDDANWWIDNDSKTIRKLMLEVVGYDEELSKIIKKVPY